MHLLRRIVVRRLARWILCAVVAVLASCGEPTAVTDGTLVVRRLPAALELENESTAPLHYFAVERGTAAVIDWIACVGTGCPSVAALGTVAVPDSQIAGFTPDAEDAIVYWWRAVPDGVGGFRADSIRSLVVPL